MPLFSIRGRSHDKDDDRLLAACLHGNMVEELSVMYKEAQANGWPLTMKTANLVILAMHAQGCSQEEVGAFYKSWIQNTGLTLQWPTMVALLASGVTVEEILKMDYKSPLEIEKLLIRALTELGRADEAREIVREILALHQRPTPMPTAGFISLLRMLIHSGFQAEAQTLVDQQGRLGLQLDQAMCLFLESVKAPVTGLTAYQSLGAIEGPHRQSLALHALLIRTCYNDRKLTKAMHQASPLSHADSNSVSPLCFKGLEHWRNWTGCSPLIFES